MHDCTTNGGGLEIGFLLPSRDAIVAGVDDPRPLVALAHRAEELGFDSVWVGDSPVARPRADALVLLSAVAATTTRVTLGTAVLLAALRDPVLLAHQLATLDALSGGRLVVGIGSGFPYPLTEAQFRAVGKRFSHRISATEESIEALRALWRGQGEPVSFDGSHVSFSGVSLRPRAVRADGPQIWLAGAGRAAEERVGRLADGWLPYPPRPEEYAAGLGSVEEAAGRVGRRPPVAALYATVTLQRDGGDAAGQLRQSVERYYDAPLPALSRIQALRSGTAGEIAEWLRSYVSAGARHLVLRLADPEPQAALDHAGRELLPLLRDIAKEIR